MPILNKAHVMSGTKKSSTKNKGNINDSALKARKKRKAKKK